MVRCSRSCVVVMLVAAACAPPQERGAPRLGATGSGIELAYASNYPSLHLRGTMNAWQATPMTLISDHLWRGEATFGTEEAPRFKLDVYGDWAVNFGDNERDSIADLGGADIPVAGAGTWLIYFNDESRFYSVEVKTWSGTVELKLPRGADPMAFSGKQLRLRRDGQDVGWSYIYADADHARPYVPVCCQEKGASYVASLDLVVAGRRYVGEVRWRVDGTVDPLDLTMDVSEASLGEFGAVETTVLSDRWENGQLVASPWSGVNVYLGDWHAGHLLGTTGNDGKLALMLPAGEQSLGMMVMTSSHSIASGSSTVTVVAGKSVAHAFHVAPVTAVIRAHYDVGYGNALYVTGATDYLGDWKVATRMTFDASSGSWTLTRNLPIGLPFKIVLGKWSDSGTISTSETQWERGGDRAVAQPAGSYEAQGDAYPQF